MGNSTPTAPRYRASSFARCRANAGCGGARLVIATCARRYPSSNGGATSVYVDETASVYSDGATSVYADGPAWVHSDMAARVLAVRATGVYTGPRSSVSSSNSGGWVGVAGQFGAAQCQRDAEACGANGAGAMGASSATGSTACGLDAASR